jgi:hypothetical protein
VRVHSGTEVEAYLGDTAGSVPDQHNKTSHEVASFPVNIKVTFTLYCSLLSAQEIMSKKQCTYLN